MMTSNKATNFPQFVKILSSTSIEQNEDQPESSENQGLSCFDSKVSMKNFALIRVLGKGG